MTGTNSIAVNGGKLVDESSGSVTTAALTIASGGVVDNSGKITSTATVTNAGTYVSEAGANTELNSGLTNTGTVNAYGGKIDGAVGNGTTTSSAANLNALSGTFTIGGALTNYATVTVSGGAKLVDTSGITNQTGGLITNNGSVGASGSASNVTANGGTINSSGNWTGDVVSNSSTTAGTINNSGNWTGALDKNANQAGAVVNNSWTWTGAGYNDGGTVNNSGKWVGAFTNDSGGFANTASGSLSGGLTNLGSATNAGTINNGVTNGSATNSTAVFTNSLGGIVNGGLDNYGAASNAGTINGGLTNESSGTFTYAGGAVYGTVTNKGTLSFSGSISTDLDNNSSSKLFVTGSLSVGGAVNNDGTLEVGNNTTNPIQTGALDVAGVLTNTGLLTVDAQSILNANGGIVNKTTGPSQAKIVNNGTVKDDLNNDGSIYINNNQQNGAVASNVNGTITNSAGAVWNGDVKANANSGGGLIDNSGAWIGDVKAGANIGGGTIKNELGATWTGAGANDGGVITNAGTWVGAISNNTGTFTTTGKVAGAVTNAGAANASGAITGAIANTGSFTVIGDLVGGSTFTNSGTAILDVTGGNLTVTAGLTNTSQGTGGGGVNSGVYVKAGETLSADTIVNGGASAGLITSDGTLTTASGLTNSANGEIDARGQINGSVANAGTFKLTGALDADGKSTFANSGTLTVDTYAFGATTAIGTFNNTTGGTTTIGAGSLTANAVSITGGTVGVTDAAGWLIGTNGISVGASGKLTDFGGTIRTGTLLNYGVLTNSGVFSGYGTILSSIVNAGAGSFTVTGGKLSLSPVLANTFENDGTATLTVNDTFDKIYTLTNNSSGNGGNAGVTIGAGGTLSAEEVINDGSLVMAGATSVLTTALTNNLTVKAEGTINGAVTNNFMFTVVGPLSSDNSSTITNASGAVLNVQGNAFTAIKEFANFGTVLVGTGGILTAGAFNQFGGSTSNAGTVGSATGASNVTIGGGVFTNNWTVNTGASGSLSILANGEFDNNGLVLSKNTVTNAGTYVSGGANAELNADLANTGTVNANGGKIDGVVSNGAVGDSKANLNTLSGKFTIGGALTNYATVTVSGGALLVDTSGIRNQSTGLIVNNGSVGGTTGSATSVTANGGTITNAANGYWTGDVVANAGVITNAANGTWTGNALAGANTGTIDSYGTWAGTGSFNAGGVINNAPTGKWTGGLTNPAGTVNNWGAISNSAPGGVGLTNSGGNAFNNTGGTIDTVSVTAGTFTNAAGGEITGAATSATITGGMFANSGKIDGAVVNGSTGTPSTPGFDNASGGAVAGLLTNTGVASNEGTLNGGASNSGSGKLTNSGTINKGGQTYSVANSAAFVNLVGGTVNGGLQNAGAGTVQAAGAINGAIVNGVAVGDTASFTVTGALKGDGATTSFTNAGKATLGFAATPTGIVFSGITTLTNNSTAAIGVDVAASDALGAGTIVNKAKATIRSLGLLATTSASGLTNDEGGVVKAEGQINGKVINSGAFTVTAGGLTSNHADFDNTGAKATLDVTASFTGQHAITNENGGTVTIRAGATEGGSAFTQTGAGSTTVVSGTLTASAESMGTGGAVTINGGAATVNSGGVINAGAAGVVVGPNGTIDNFGTVSAGANATAGVLANSGAFINEASGAVTPSVVNAGTIKALGGTFAGAIGNTGSFTVTGAVAASNVFTNNAGGTLAVTSGGLTGLAGLSNLSSGPSGGSGVTVAQNSALSAQAIANAGTISTAGTLEALTAPLVNTGTITATGGVVNGPLGNNKNAIDNKGTFTVAAGAGGTVTTASSFLNEPNASLNVNSGSYTILGLLTNYSAITVLGGATLTGKSGILNMPGFTVHNYGTITDDLSNTGAVTNASGATYNANVALNNGTIVNLGTWNGSVNQNANVAGGVIENPGSWVGTAMSYNDGGTINNTGTWSGGLTNDLGVINNSGQISGGLASTGGVTNNTGTISGGVTATGGVVNSYAPASVINGNVSVAGSGVVNALGTINGNVSVNGGALPAAGQAYPYLGVFAVTDATGLPAAVGSPQKTLVLNGSLSGPITMPINLTTGASNYIQVSGSTSGAGTNLSGTLTNPTNQLWTTPNRILTYSNASIPLTATSHALLVSASSIGLYDYVATPNNNGIAQQLKLGVITAPLNQVSALITGLNTSFFSNAQAFLGAPQNPTANMWYGGVWSRGGGAEMTSETSSSGGGALYPPSIGSRYQTTTGGIQLGLDEGLYNINATGWNVHFGLTGGEAWGIPPSRARATRTAARST